MKCGNCGNQIITAGPKPFYEQVRDSVVENHETIIHKNVYPAGVLVCESWNVPDVNQDLALKLDGVTLIPVGSYLYSPQYGYFHITQWNPETGQVGILNEQIPGTAAPGTFVPQHTLFLVTPKPCCEDDTSTFFPFLADNFIAPSVGESRVIAVTSSFGLVVGEYVRIGEAVYRLDSINSTVELEIFNQGAGHVPGTEVEALDENGEYQYLLTAEASFVCTVDVETTSGRVIVCDAGEQKIITGAGIGHVLKLIDPVTGQAAFGIIDSSNIEDNSVGTAEIIDRSITGVKLVLGAVGTGELGINAVNVDRILNGNVTTPKLSNGAVDSTKLANNAVLPIHVASSAAGTVYTPTIHTNTGALVAASFGRYYVLGSMILVYVQVSGALSGPIEHFIATLPTATVLGVGASQFWPAFVQKEILPTLPVVTELYTNWGGVVLGGSLGGPPGSEGYIYVKFDDTVASFATAFSVWGIYPYK